jgi:MFS family permease
MNPEDQLMRKVIWRIVPLIFVLFILNSIDRVNVSFAALQMNREQGFSPQIYGMGVAAFFVSYLLFQIPITLLAKKIGPRLCLGSMSIAWGLAAAGMSFVHTPLEFYALRFVLGLTEAGFAPVTLYIYSTWIPARYRARVTSKNTIAIAVSIIIGAPLSGWLMTSHNTLLGMSGWRWMFFAEGFLPVVLGVFTLIYLPNSPREASWLSPAESSDLLAAVEGEATNALPTERRVSTLRQVARSPGVWACAGAWFSLTMGVYGIIFWLPQAIKGLSSLNDFDVAVLSAVSFPLFFAFQGRLVMQPPPWSAEL